MKYYKKENITMKKKENIKTDINNSPQNINRKIKTLRNWDWSNTPNAKKERSINIGQYVEISDVKGFISRIEGDDVFVEDSIQQGKIVKFSMKQFLKAFKQVKKEKDIVIDLSIVGPSNQSKGEAPKIGKETTVKVNAKSTKASDQKISNKINKIKSIKSFTDLSKEFDTTIIKNKKNTITPEINGKVNKSDDILLKKNTIIKYIKSFTEIEDLKSNPQIGKIVKSKENEIGKNIDLGKSTKSEDNKITKKISKVKTFTELISKIQTGPNKTK
jgi:hypothetical protein